MPNRNDNNNKPPHKGGVVERMPQAPSTEVTDATIDKMPPLIPTAPTKGK